MAFKIFRNDITKVCADAIVNTANPFTIIGHGIDFSIYKAAGIDELLEARKKIGFIKSGNSACTPAFNLEKNGVKYIIHSVGILYQDGKSGEIEILRNCYKSALKIALEKKCKSVAIPLLASAGYAFMPSSRFDLIIKYCVMNQIYNLINVDVILDDHGEECFSSN